MSHTPSATSNITQHAHQELMFICPFTLPLPTTRALADSYRPTLPIRDPHWHPPRRRRRLIKSQTVSSPDKHLEKTEVSPWAETSPWPITRPLNKTNEPIFPDSVVQACAMWSTVKAADGSHTPPLKKLLCKERKNRKQKPLGGMEPRRRKSAGSRSKAQVSDLSKTRCRMRSILQEWREERWSESV
jgi:hypothetical protein